MRKGKDLAEFNLSLLIALVVVIIILSQAIKIVREYERVVIFRLGRLSGAKGPGIIFIIPIIDRVILMDLRVFTIDVKKQVVITRDNVSVEVDAVIYYRVVDPANAVVQVNDYNLATSLLAQTTLRDVLGQIELDDLLSKREELNRKLQEILDRHTDPWGIKVTAVTIRDVALPDNLRRAIAKQAESEREKRSRIILADGEFQASKTMTDAARLYEEVPAALRLRELQTLVDIAREKTLIVVTPSGDSGTDTLVAMSAAFQKESIERGAAGLESARLASMKETVTKEAPSSKEQ
ncbi:MAG: slipin family protein [Methanotrichaceae archaeon]|nr:slipin family protein [Methanotrichaceae archaeon]